MRVRGIKWSTVSAFDCTTLSVAYVDAHIMCLTGSYGYFWALVQNLLPAGGINTSNFSPYKKFLKCLHTFIIQKSSREDIYSAVIIGIV